jgi:hypothetical protein
MEEHVLFSKDKKENTTTRNITLICKDPRNKLMDRILQAFDSLRGP